MDFRRYLLIVPVMLLVAASYIGGLKAADGDSNFTNVIATGSITSFHDLTIGGSILRAKQTTITVTNAGAFAPTGSFQPITAAGAVTPVVTIASAGTMVTLYNSGTNAITIADTGIQKLSGDAVLGQYDALTIVSDGTNWIEVGRSDN